MALTVVLSALLPSSCTSTKGKVPAAKQLAPVAAEAAAASKNKNLGELLLTNYYETRVQLCTDKSCLITPKIVDRSKVQLTVMLESKNPGEKSGELSVVQVVGKAGKPFEVAVGDMNLTLTPKLAAQ